MSGTFERIYDPATETANALTAAADPACTREVMAGFYVDLLRTAQVHGHKSVDFAAVNRAILTRWPKGLEWIKRRAWKLLEGT